MVIINEKYIENSSDAFLNFDEGFSFGKGVFETIFLKGSTPVLLEKHISRINFGAKKLGIKNSVTEEYLFNIIKLFNLKDCILKLILSDNNIVITTRDNPYSSNDYLEGFSLTVSQVRRNETSLLTYFKWTGYLENILEKKKAMDLGYNDTLFLNSKGKITETTVANLFFIKNGIIHTPKISCGILNGTLRMWILENFRVLEGVYSLDDLLSADEIFITNSIVGVIKIRSINSIKFDSTTLTSEISSKYFNFLENL